MEFLQETQTLLAFLEESQIRITKGAPEEISELLRGIRVRVPGGYWKKKLLELPVETHLVISQETPGRIPEENFEGILNQPMVKSVEELPQGPYKELLENSSRTVWENLINS